MDGAVGSTYYCAHHLHLYFHGKRSSRRADGKRWRQTWNRNSNLRVNEAGPTSIGMTRLDPAHMMILLWPGKSLQHQFSSSFIHRERCMTHRSYHLHLFTELTGPEKTKSFSFETSNAIPTTFPTRLLLCWCICSRGDRRMSKPCSLQDNLRFFGYAEPCTVPFDLVKMSQTLKPAKTTTKSRDSGSINKKVPPFPPT